MDKPTIKRLGKQLRKEIVPLHDLPFPMREALRKLAEKFDGCQPSDAHNDNSSHQGRDSGGPGQPFCSSLSKL